MKTLWKKGSRTSGVYRLTLHWSNWTFGIWWGSLGRTDSRNFGIDFGPLEFLYSIRKLDR